MNQAAWILLTILFAGLLLALVRGGWTGTGGAQSWFRVKFKGQPA
jgi:cell division protein FtsW (lipid II flippase)